MIAAVPGFIPRSHRDFLERAVPILAADSRFFGVAAGGSYAAGTLDVFSDLDLVIAVEPDAWEGVLLEARGIAASLGSLLAAFTGEHAAEHRLICLYDEPLLHVDLEFLTDRDFERRVEDPSVLWERDGRLSLLLSTGAARYPEPDRAWIEARFWVWVHYGATKIARGELFEAIEFLSFLRVTVLGPLALQSVRARPTGVRRLEALVPDLARAIERTLATHDAKRCLAALRAAVEIYLSLRSDSTERETAAERAALFYLADIERRFGVPD